MMTIFAKIMRYLSSKKSFIDLIMNEINNVHKDQLEKLYEETFFSTY